MASVDDIRREIDQALRSRNVRVAVLVADTIRNALNLIDEQPAAVLEAMVGAAEELQQSGGAPKHRYDIRAALIKYLKERRSEAEARERHLARAITGGDLPAD